MSMREKIARALYASDWNGMKMPAWDDVSDGVKAEYYRETDAVLDALMEPSEAMQLAGGIKLEEMMFGGDDEATGVIFTDCGVVFREMIQAARAEK